MGFSSSGNEDVPVPTKVIVGKLSLQSFTGKQSCPDSGCGGDVMAEVVDLDLDLDLVDLGL